jgi:hypothetical protein
LAGFHHLRFKLMLAGSLILFITFLCWVSEKIWNQRTLVVSFFFFFFSPKDSD